MTAHRPHPPDQAERERALDITRSALVLAPAGSGKTTLLVSRFLKCLVVSGEPEEVVAITFTIKAAAEIRTRLIEALRAAGGIATQSDRELPPELRALAAQVLARSHARGWALLDNPNRLRAMTIDALNSELAARLPLLSGHGGRMAITEIADGLFEAAVHALFAEVEEADLPDAEREALHAVLRWADNRLDLLVEPLAAMLEKREQWLKPVLRLLRGDAAPDDQVLCALAQGPLCRLEALLDAGLRRELAAILREASAHSEQLAWAAGLTAWPASEPARFEEWRQLAGMLVTNAGELRKAVNVRQGFPAKLASTERMNAFLKNLGADPRADEIAQACRQLLDFPGVVFPPLLLEQRTALARLLLRLAQHLKLVCGRRGETDFTEIALAAIRALSGEHGYSEVLDQADTRIRHLLVDEMQDTSESQIELLELLTSGWIPGDGHSLFLVGDPQQSIYSFRKAEVRLFLQLWDTRRLGEVPLERITLTANFRSHPVLIDWFNASFSRIFPRLPDRDAGIVAYSPCEAGRGGDSSATAVSIVPFWQDDVRGEAEAVAARAKALWTQHGDSASIAILGRTRMHLHHAIGALRRAGLPVACQDIDPLHDLPAVCEYVHLARALWHPEDRLAWAVLLRSPLVGLSYADLVLMSRGAKPGGPRRSWPQRIVEALADGRTLSAEGRQRLQRLMDVLAQADNDHELYGNLAARAEAVWHALGGPATIDAGEWRDVQSAMTHLREAAPSGEIESPAELRRRLGSAFASPTAGAIQVMTMHKAKGLEFDHVLLVGCGRKGKSENSPLLQYRAFADGLLLVPRPSEQLPKDDPAHALFKFMKRLQQQALDAELMRLLYVACTRARESLTLFASVPPDAGGAPRPLAGSFAALLWPLIEADFRVLATTPTAERPQPSAEPPRSPRLPADYRFHPDDVAWRPREQRTLRPSEAVLDAQAQKAREGDLHARLIGVMFHEAMRRIAVEGLEHWQDAGVSRRLAMAAGFRHLGLPEPAVAGAVERVLLLLARSLASERGRWLLQPRAWAESEYAIAGYRDGEWISAIVDRCFEEDGAVWVVDYKTGRESAAEAVARYGHQLGQYAALIAAVRRRPTRGALFLAETAEWVEMEALAEPA